MRGKKGLTNTQPGEVFGELTYIRHVGYNKNNAIGEFKCSCGLVVEKPISNVVHGATRTCGHALEGRTQNYKAKKKYVEEKKEGVFDVDAYFKSDFILQS